MTEKRVARELKRINVGLTEKDHTKLERLAFAVERPKTVLAGDILSLCLSNPNIIEFIQRRFNAHEDRKVKPVVTENGQVIYS